MPIEDYLEPRAIALGEQALTWEEAVRRAGGLLEDAGAIDAGYTDAMVAMVRELGPYIVITPGVALAHARPCGHVRRNAVALLTLSEGVSFGNPSNDPVYLVFALAAVSDEDHLGLFQATAELLEGEGNIRAIREARTLSELPLRLANDPIPA